MKDVKKIVVIGLGYIGLPTAVMLANSGHTVQGYDIDEEQINKINSLQVNYDEPGLEEHLKDALISSNLSVSSCLRKGDCYIVAVPTPLNNDNNSADLGIFQSVIDKLIPILKPFDLLIIESTSPVGTSDKVIKEIIKNRPDLVSHTNSEHNLLVDICYCPERVLPGAIIHELKNNSRIIGGSTGAATRRAKSLYASFVLADSIETDLKTAEMIKLTENAYRDVNIAFANEVANICELDGIDTNNLISLANLHPRVNILRPGIGVGGHCIAVDPWFLISAKPSETKLMKCARETNKDRENKTRIKIQDQLSEIATDRTKLTVLFMGITYKPNVGDVRESPALNILSELRLPKNIIGSVYDPLVLEKPKKINHYDFYSHLGEEKFDVYIKLVDHDRLDLEKIGGGTLIDFT